MKNKSKSLREKILLLCVGIVFLAIIVFAAIGVIEINTLLGMVVRGNVSENQVIENESEDLVWEYMLNDVIDTVDAAARETDGELWTLIHDYNVLGKQVEDVFVHPDRYQEVDPESLTEDAESRYVPKIMFAEWADQNDEENMAMIRKLTCLTPIMEQIKVGNDDFTTDCYISLPSGITLALDDKPEDLVNPDGSIKYYDPTNREWYKGAVSTGKPYFTSVEDSFFHKHTGMGSGFPIYVDGNLVAVLHGFTKLETLQDRAEQIKYPLADYTILISNEGQLIYSPNKSGELAMDDDLSKDLRQTSNPDLKELFDSALTLETAFMEASVDGRDYYACYAPIKTLGWSQIMFISCDKLNDIPMELLRKIDDARDRVYRDYAVRFRVASVVIIAAMAVLIFGAAILASVFSKRLVTPVDVMTKRVMEMTGDDMDFKMESVYKTGDEIEILANSFSGLTDKLKAYIVENAAITAQKERIDAEMALSSKIQDSMLPRKFPPFPDRSEFELFADMRPAREVGGDFYDYYFIDDDHLALIIGDVSGKGITAALFMVMTKHIIQSQILLHSGDVAATLESAHALLMEENAARMFVTLWLGVLTVSTGQLTFANAGHTNPVLCRSGGQFEYITDKHGLPLASRKKITVIVNETRMGHGDVLYLYTDGMTEAINVNNKMFGFDRLRDVLDKNKDSSMKEIDEAVRRAVNEFAEGTEQFDDMTSLEIKLL